MTTVPKFGAAPNLAQISITFTQVQSIEPNAFNDLPSLLVRTIINYEFWNANIDTISGRDSWIYLKH